METKEVLYELRTKNRLSQDELAEKLFVTRQAVSRWENGDTLPNTETLKALSKLFGVSINTLLGAPRQLVCQCCGMPLEDELIGREKDGENVTYAEGTTDEGAVSKQNDQECIAISETKEHSLESISGHEITTAVIDQQTGGQRKMMPDESETIGKVTETDESIAAMGENILRKTLEGVLLIIGSDIWLTGIIAMLAYVTISFVRLRIRLRTAARLEESAGGKVWMSDAITEPFVLGIVKPRIYLPSRLEAGDLDCVLCHERAHVKRGDYLWKPLGFLILCVYWFHPLCWISYLLFSRDVEMACDEKATKDFDVQERKRYCQALLNLGQGKKNSLIGTVAFGENGTKARVKAVLDYKKPSVWVILAGMLACLAMGIFFMSSPSGNAANADDAEKSSKTVEGKDAFEEKPSDEEEGLEKSSGSAGKDDQALALIDFDGDGKADEVQVQVVLEDGQYFDEVIVLLGNGETYSLRYSGRTDGAKDTLRVDTGRITEKEKTDIVLQITDGKENYGSSDVHVIGLAETSDGKELKELLTILDAGQNSRDYEKYQDTMLSAELINATISMTERDELVRRLSSIDRDAVCITVINSYYDGELLNLAVQAYVYYDHGEWKTSWDYGVGKQIGVGLEGWNFGLGDLDENGIYEYVTYRHFYGSAPENILTVYLNGECIYELRKEIIDILNWRYSDFDGDGVQELFLSLWSGGTKGNKNDYVVLKKTGLREWKALEEKHAYPESADSFPIQVTYKKNQGMAEITLKGFRSYCDFSLEDYCKGMEKRIASHECTADEKRALQKNLAEYKKILQTPWEELAGKECGSVNRWGLKEVVPDYYDGLPCLMATYGIIGMDEQDDWGRIKLWFRYDKDGKTQVLMMLFDSIMSLPVGEGGWGYQVIRPDTTELTPEGIETLRTGKAKNMQDQSMEIIAPDRSEVLSAYYGLIHLAEEAIYDPQAFGDNRKLYQDSEGKDLFSQELWHLFDGRNNNNDIAWQNIGYLMRDIDGDGVEELFFGENDPDPNGTFNGVIYDIYAYQDHQLVHLLSGWTKNCYYLTENGMIAHEIISAASEGYWEFLRYDGHGLEFVESVEMVLQNDNKRIYKHTTLNGMEEITEKAQKAVRDKYVYVHPDFSAMGPTWSKIDDVNEDGLDDYLIAFFYDGVCRRLSLYLMRQGVVFDLEEDDVGFGGRYFVDLDGDGEKEIFFDYDANGKTR